MKEFNIKITDTEVYLNGKLQYFSCPMDKENKEDDLNKKAIVALADAMNYEAQFLFEEMADRLDEMLDEIDEEDFDMRNFDDELDVVDDEYNDDNDFLQGLLDDAETEEMIGYWLEELVTSFGKSNVDELTAKEISIEIDDIKGTISNESIVLGISEFAEKNIEQYEAYLKVLEEMLNNKEEF